MNASRVAAIIIIIVSFFVWLFVPFLTVETLGIETTMTASSLLTNSDSALERTTIFFWMALISLLSLILCLIDVITKKPGRGLASSSGMGIGLLAVGGIWVSVAVNSVQSAMGMFSSLLDMRLSTGFYILLIAFIVLCCLGSAMKKEAEAETTLPPTTYTYLSKNTKQTVNRDATNTPNAQTVDENDVQWLTCCQCGKTAKRTEFYEINVNGNANLGTCHQCYDKFY